MPSENGEVIKCEYCGVLNDPEDTMMNQGEVAACKNTRDCETRQLLRRSFPDAVVYRKHRSPMPEVQQDPDQYLKKAKRMVVEQIRNNFPIDTMAVMPQESDFYVTWFSKTLGNWKALVSTDVVSGHYWEVTYDGNKKKTYVDHYIKSSNEAFSDMDYHRWVTPMEERNYEFRSLPYTQRIEVSRDGDLRYRAGMERWRNGSLVPPQEWLIDMDGSRMSVQMMIHRAFPDIPMRHVPSE